MTDAHDDGRDETLLGSFGGASTATQITPGTDLGPYDSRLGRTVAIKVLPNDRVADPERKRRFLQEARAASALNSGIDFLVMEYVEGKSLDKLIPSRRSRAPWRQRTRRALSIAISSQAMLS